MRCEVLPGRKTDGWLQTADPHSRWGDNCGRDACQTVETHREIGIRYPIYVAAMGVDGTEREELMCIARTSGGLYRDVVSQGQLVQALDDYVRDLEVEAP